VSQFNFALILTLNVPANTSFIASFYGFLLATATAARVSANSIIVVSITEGSYIVSMLISSNLTPGTPEAVAQQTAV
jgi:hypothetical protein